MYIKKEVTKEDFVKSFKNSTSFILNSTIEKIYNYIKDYEEHTKDYQEFNLQEIEENFQEIENITEKKYYNFEYFLDLKNGNYLLSNILIEEE